MPILNDSSDGHLSNANMAAHAHEARVTQGAKEHTGREATNAGTAANLHEQRATQETGTH
jgi:hypothetical protein